MQRPLSVESGIDDQFHALAHPARRQLLLALYREQPVDDGTVVVADEPIDVSAFDLHHTHVPKLRDLGYLRYDEVEGTIEPGPDFEEIEWLLAELSERAASGEVSLVPATDGCSTDV